MKIAELDIESVSAKLAGGGLYVKLGPYSIRIQSDFKSIADNLFSLYRDYDFADCDELVDFHVQVSRPVGVRHFARQQAWFYVDGRAPFFPLPAAHATPLLEWGLNWCVATRSHHLLMLHSAVTAREGKALLCPAWPGHGKSTLCAALVHSGWRLLSDEFGLVQPDDGQLVPLPRLIALKNESINVIRQFSSDAVIGPSFEGTRKGTVAHVKPPLDSIERSEEPAEPRWFVFPKWVKDAAVELKPMAKSQAFLMVATNSFNYDVLGGLGFRLVREMVERCDCYSLIYSDLEQALAQLDQLE